MMPTLDRFDRRASSIYLQHRPSMGAELMVVLRVLISSAAVVTQEQLYHVAIAPYPQQC
jgi:hypothetical protein